MKNKKMKIKTESVALPEVEMVDDIEEPDEEKKSTNHIVFDDVALPEYRSNNLDE